ncbi:hypothetical protein RFI_23392, partial [Reticulomyxa filosa]
MKIKVILGLKMNYSRICTLKNRNLFTFHSCKKKVQYAVPFLKKRVRKIYINSGKKNMPAPTTSKITSTLLNSNIRENKKTKKNADTQSLMSERSSQSKRSKRSRFGTRSEPEGKRKNKRSAFGDPSRSITLRLVPRDADDPLRENDSKISEYVLEPEIESEAQEKLVQKLFKGNNMEDVLPYEYRSEEFNTLTATSKRSCRRSYEYDYTQHYRTIGHGNGVFVPHNPKEMDPSLLRVHELRDKPVDDGVPEDSHLHDFAFEFSRKHRPHSQKGGSTKHAGDGDNDQDDEYNNDDDDEEEDLEALQLHLKQKNQDLVNASDYLALLESSDSETENNENFVI